MIRTSVFGLRTFPNLRLIYGWRGHFVGKVSAMGQPTRPTQPFAPGVGKWVVVHVITWITRVATIKRQARDAYGC